MATAQRPPQPPPQTPVLPDVITAVRLTFHMSAEMVSAVLLRMLEQQGWYEPHPSDKMNLLHMDGGGVEMAIDRMPGKRDDDATDPTN